MVRIVIQRASQRETADPATSPTVPTPLPGQLYPQQHTQPYPQGPSRTRDRDRSRTAAGPQPAAVSDRRGISRAAPGAGRGGSCRTSRAGRGSPPCSCSWASSSGAPSPGRSSPALSGALHLIGVNVHLPDIRFGWPWQSITAGTTTNTMVGPLVLQKIEGISRPALGTENFNFLFTHKVSKNIGPWPCWYSAHVLRGRPGVRHGRPQPRSRLVEVRHRPLPAARAAPAGRGRAGQARHHHGAAASPAAAVGARRVGRQHPVQAGLLRSQLDLPGPGVRRAHPAAVLSVGALRAGAERGVLPGDAPGRA